MGKEALLAVVGVSGAVALGYAHGGEDRERGGEVRAVFAGGSVEAGEPQERPPPVARRPARRRFVAGRSRSAQTIVTVARGRSVRLRDRPRGRVLASVPDRTPFGSRSVFAVARRAPGWLGVLSSDLPNGRIGWIRDDAGVLERDRVPVRIVVDRSERRLTLVRAGREVLSAPVGVGRPGSETPTGTFAVTDKLDGRRFAPAYGCCVLALSGRQTRLPPGWRGGDRLALHGATGSVARVRTAGCVALDEVPVRRLMESVPLGTVVTIRP